MRKLRKLLLLTGYIAPSGSGPASGDGLQLEDASFLLLEDGSFLLLE